MWLRVLSFSLSTLKNQSNGKHLKNCNGYSWGIFYMNFTDKFPKWNKISFRTPTALRLRKAVRCWKTNEIVPGSLILPQWCLPRLRTRCWGGEGGNEADWKPLFRNGRWFCWEVSSRKIRGPQHQQRHEDCRNTVEKSHHVLIGGHRTSWGWELKCHGVWGLWEGCSPL